MQDGEALKTQLYKPIEKENLFATDFIAADQIGIMPVKIKDNLVPFERRDLERIIRKLESGKNLTNNYLDFQNASFLCAGIFFTVLTFLLALVFTTEISKTIVITSSSVAVLAFVLSVVFWVMSRKLKKIDAGTIEEVLDEMKHLSNKFLYENVTETNDA